MVADFMGLVNLVPGKVRALANGGGTVEALARPDARRRRARRAQARRRRRRRDPSGKYPSCGGPAGASAKLAKITNHVFLGNINEYYATLRSGQVLRVQTHPLQQFRIGDEVAIEVDATQCSVFRRAVGDAT